MSKITQPQHDHLSIFLDCPGGIVAKGRPKFRQTPKFVQAYTPKKTVDAEESIRRQFLQAFGDMYKDFDGEVYMDINLAIPLPKSYRQDMVGTPILKRPDIDNYAKLVLDALNGVAFKDDSQITRLTVSKEPYQEKGTLPQIHLRLTYFK
jgi:Holliday junction resolvase RusA-like endonuclease